MGINEYNCGQIQDLLLSLQGGYPVLAPISLTFLQIHKNMEYQRNRKGFQITKSRHFPYSKNLNNFYNETSNTNPENGKYGESWVLVPFPDDHYYYYKFYGYTL